MTRTGSEKEYDVELRIPDDVVLVRFFFADGSYMDVPVESDDTSEVKQ